MLISNRFILRNLAKYQYRIYYSYLNICYSMLNIWIFGWQVGGRMIETYATSVKLGLGVGWAWQNLILASFLDKSLHGQPSHEQLSPRTKVSSDNCPLEKCHLHPCQKLSSLLPATIFIAAGSYLYSCRQQWRKLSAALFQSDPPIVVTPNKDSCNSFRLMCKNTGL